MFSLMVPATSAGLVPSSSVLWFDASGAFFILITALAVSALCVLVAGWLGSARRPRLSPPPPGRGRPIRRRPASRWEPARSGGIAG